MASISKELGISELEYERIRKALSKRAGGDSKFTNVMVDETLDIYSRNGRDKNFILSDLGIVKPKFNKKADNVSDIIQGSPSNNDEINNIIRGGAKGNKDIEDIIKGNARNNKDIEDIIKKNSKAQNSGVEDLIPNSVKVSGNINGVNTEAVVTDPKETKKLRKALVKQAVGDEDEITTGLSDLTQKLFGNKVTQDELGRHIYGDKYDPKKHTKVYYETNQSHAYALGEFVASHQDDLVDDYKKGTKRKRVADFNKILPGDENTATRYEMEVGFNKKMEGINYRRSVDKAFTSVNKETEKARKEYIDKLSKMSPELRGKIYHGGVLTDAEKQELSDLQQEFKTIQGKYDKVAEQFDTDPEKFFAYKEGKDGGPKEYANYNKTYNDFQGKVKQVGGNINDITISEDGHVMFNTPKFEKTILNNQDELKDFNSQAMSTAMGKWSNEKDYKDYRSVFKDYSDEEVGASYKKLLDLEKRGIILPDEAKDVLINKASALKGKVDSTDEGLIALDSNAEAIANRYNVSRENIKYISTYATNSDGIEADYNGEEVLPLKRGLNEQNVSNINMRNDSLNYENKGSRVFNQNVNYEGLSLEMDDEGNVKISNDSWQKMTKSEREKYKNIKGNEDLSGLDSSIKGRKYMRDTIADNGFNGNEDEFLNDINKKWKNSKNATSKYGLTREQQFKEMGASDEMIEKLNKGEKLTGHDVKGFKYQNFDESYIELGNLSEDAMDRMIKDYQGDIGDINNVSLNTKQDKARTLYKDIVKKRADEVSDIADEFEFNLDVSDEKAVRKFLENINANRTTGDQIDVAKMMSEYVTKNKANKKGINVGNIIEEYLDNGTTGVSNLIKDTNDKNAKDMFNKAFDKVIGILEKSGNEDLKNLGGHFKKMARDDNFTKDVIEKTSFKEAVNSVPEFKSLKDGKGMEIAKKAMGNKYVKGAAIVAGAVGIGAMAIGAMNNAAEERERKRQEMNMLIASQNSSIRGGY